MPEETRRLNPAGMPDASKAGYAQITVSRPGPLAFVSGQVAWKADSSAVPATIGEQTKIVIENLSAALAAIEAVPSDILQMRIYATELTDETQTIVMSQLSAFLDGALPALTAVAVTALAAPDLKIEIEMTVQLPG
ncbi:RidA family protein [Roseibium sp.]|uniref:RidA family protein n=1 Tax=Roseibium sp. TaxID=1936156 RepID=UPI003A973994